MKKTWFMLSLILIIPQSIFACEKLVDCLVKASKLTGYEYIYDPNIIKETVKTSGDLEMKAENADLFISEILSMHGYSRIQLGAEKVYKIIPSRDIRYAGKLKQFSATKETLNAEIPFWADYMELTYQTKNGAKRVSAITRNLRPLLSRYGRVIDTPNGIIMAIDQGTNLNKILDFIRIQDVPFTKEEEQREKRNNFRHQDHTGIEGKDKMPAAEKN